MYIQYSNIYTYTRLYTYIFYLIVSVVCSKMFSLALLYAARLCSSLSLSLFANGPFKAGQVRTVRETGVF